MNPFRRHVLHLLDRPVSENIVAAQALAYAEAERNRDNDLHYAWNRVITELETIESTELARAEEGNDACAHPAAQMIVDAAGVICGACGAGFVPAAAEGASDAEV